MDACVTSLSRMENTFQYMLPRAQSLVQILIRAAASILENSSNKSEQVRPHLYNNYNRKFRTKDETTTLNDKNTWNRISTDVTSFQKRRNERSVFFSWKDIRKELLIINFYNSFHWNTKLRKLTE